MICGGCRYENLPDASFCQQCGAALAIRCDTCGTDLPATARFCHRCGSASSEATRTAPSPRSYTPKHLAEKILTSRSALEGERKHVTVLFADLKGSMDLSESIDPEEWHRIMDRFFAILAEGVHRFEGTINQYTGDGIMALFGAPIAHEDHPQRACYAALALQEDLRRYANELRLEKGLNFSVRMGLNSGEVVVGKIGDDLRMDYTALGHTASLAARMEQIAAPDRAYLTEHTARLVDGFVTLEDLGRVAVKGVKEPVQVYELQGVERLRTKLEVSRARGFSRFVGRSDEMATLEAALARAIEGNGQVVGVVAHPGLGKSRLCYEFLERCRDRGVAVYEAHGVSHGKLVPFLPILELFRGFFRITEEDIADAAREKIAGRMLLLDEALKDALPLVFDFLGVPDPERPLPQMEPEARLRQLFAIVKRVVQARSRREPAVVLVEDLHWLDGGSEAMLEVLVEAAEGTRTLLVVNFRPEYHARWMQKSRYQQLPLLPLSPKAVEELLKDLLGTDPSVSSLGERIRERTGGNPFFMEETVQALAETKALEGTKGAYRLARPVEELTLPATVQSVLAARIDRLREREKEVLQTAAVIGREFSEPVLRRVAELSETDLSAALGSLTAAELVYEQALYPEAEYIFKHALTQEVAYGSLLNERRQTLHERAGEAIEAVFADDLDEHLGELARHYTHSRNIDKAMEYSQHAGLRALYRSANTEAIKHLKTALALLADEATTVRSVERELAIRVALGTALVASGGYGSSGVEEMYTRARHLCHELGTADQVFPVLRGLWASYLAHSEYRAATTIAEEFLSLARERRHPGVIVEGCFVTGFTSLLRGELLAARDLSEEGIAIYESKRDFPLAFLFGVDPGVDCVSCSPLALWCLGYADQALKRSREAVALARTLDHPFSRCWAATSAAQLQQYGRDAKAVQREAETVIALSSDHGFPFWLAWATILRGWALAHRDDGDEGVRQIRTGIEAMRATNAVFVESYWLALLAESYVRVGRTEEALMTLAEAVSVIDRTEERFFEAEIQRIQGELLLESASPDVGEARRHFLRAIDVARRQSAKRWELRSTTSLARLLRRQGKKEEAREMLAEIYGWFTEGFDTADLKEARALLEELR